MSHCLYPYPYPIPVRSAFADFVNKPAPTIRGLPEREYALAVGPRLTYAGKENAAERIERSLRARNSKAVLA